jgi:hypothetical protein
MLPDDVCATDRQVPHSELKLSGAFLSPMLRLFTTIYPEKNRNRRLEYLECLHRNIACPVIDEICILVEGTVDFLPASGKLQTRPVANRPCYADFFSWINEVVRESDVSLVANTDIFFDGQMGVFKLWRLPDRTALALARWDVGPDGQAALRDRNDSQDTWIFRGPVRGVQGDFPVGVPRCDNRILFELQQAGFQVLNPAFSIRTYHLHEGVRAEYADESLPHYVPPPYRYLWPHNLFGPLRTLWHNLLHPGCRLYYRWDQRRFRGLWPVRVVNRIYNLLRHPAKA